MFGWLQAHMFWAAFAVICLVVLAATIAAVRWIVAHWWEDDEPERHPVWWQTDPEGVPWDGAGGADFEAELDDEWAAELHSINTDLPGPAGDTGGWAGEHHHSNERTVTRDVWDEWWNGLDGLDRELLACRASREREERLWADLVAETRELCAA